MKSAFSLLCSLVLISPALADSPRTWPELKTVAGTVYKDATLRAVEGDGIKISHAAGIARVSYEEMPADLAQELGLTAEGVKTARKKQLQERADARAEQKVKAAETLRANQANAKEKARLEKLEWVSKSLKVHQVVEGGLICYKHNPGGGGGSAARAVASLTGGVVSDEPAWTDYATPIFVEGVKEKVAEGDILTGKAARDGVKEIDGRTLQRWITKPD